MNRTSTFARGAFMSLIFFAFSISAYAEGTKQLSPDTINECMLYTNGSGFGFFAEYNSGDSTALFLRISDTSETVYIGLSRKAGDNGDLETIGDYQFRIVDPNGNVVHGPFFINNATNNAASWALASAGPDVLSGSGYSTALPFATFKPDTIGDFRIEFSDAASPGVPDQGNVANVKWFDFTVVDAMTTEMTGRLWSLAWALRTPPDGIGNIPPDCQFNRGFNGALYSYTMDGFVSKIDFDSSGFQGLTFNVSFGLSGPGSTGDIIADRMSLKNVNATVAAADHMVFVSEPDLIEFPSAADPCGDAELLGIQCLAQDSFCINIGVTRMGQVEVLLDFGVDSLNVILAMVFDMPDTACLFWDGLKGDGTPVNFGDSVFATLRYSQGVQHYAAYDVELLKSGFCVQTIRPICPGVSTDRLYWDDSNITDDINTGIDESDPGTGQPQVQLGGCSCGIDSCRTWTNFQVGNNNDCTGSPMGYGDENTLNTWWFASSVVIGPLVLPIVQVEIAGDTSFCPGDSTELMAMGTPDTIAFAYAWSGPGGFSATTQSTGLIGVAGTYFVTITDTVANCTATDSAIVEELVAPITSIAFTCVGANMQNGNIDLTVTGSGPFTYLWSNGAMTEDISDVPPGQYSVIVTDTSGCMAFDTVLVEGCCELMILCPPSNGGLFSCLDDVPVPDTTLIVLTNFCDSVTIVSVDVHNGTGCANDTMIVTRTYTVTDATGATMQCVQLFMVVDDLAPGITSACPADTSIACGGSIDTSLLGVPTFMDACDGVMLTFVDDSTGFDGTCTANVLGTVARTFFAMDSCGNVDSSCVQVISIIDTIAPTFSAPMDIVIQCDQDSLPTTTGEVTDTLDNCSAITLTFSDQIFAGICPTIDSIVRTWTATDACGNSTSADQIITRIDTVAPTYTLPIDIIIACDQDSFPATTGDITDAMDNCSAITITFSDVVVPDGCPANDSIFRTWIVTDACGNSSSGLQTIVRIDTVPPTFTAPADITISCEQDSLPATTGIVTDTMDNCTELTLVFVDNVVPGICPSTDTIFRTWVASDLCGNSSSAAQTIVRVDTTGPVITFCPVDTTIDCNTSIDPADLGSPTATDNCTDDMSVIITFTDDVMAGQCSADAPIVRTWSAEDICGNVTTCQQIITIQDTIAPSVLQGTCPIDLGVDCSASTDTADLGAPAYLDNCSGPGEIIITFSDDSTGFDGTCTNQVLGTITRTFFGTDACGNVDSSCVQIISLIDTIAPTFTVPVDTIIDCGLDSVPANTGMITDTLDNCSGGITVDFTDVVVQDGCPARDTIFRTWSVSDACGNIGTGLQVIVRTDTVAPTFILPADITLSCTSATDTSITGVVTDTLDNCGSTITVSFSDQVITGVCPAIDTTLRTWIVSDECGNSDSGVQTIVREDNQAPTFTVPADVVIQCDGDSTPASTGMPTDVLDSCSQQVAIAFTDNIVIGTCPAIDTIIRVWSAIDDCGNSSSQTQIITRVDTVAPTLVTCPADTVFECSAASDTLGLPTYTDNCGMVSITFVDDSIGFMPPGNLGQIIRTFYGTDDCGNVDSSCVQTITIQDITPPTITCPVDTIVMCPSDADTSITGLPTFADNCNAVEDLVMTFSDDSTGFMGACSEGSIIRTFVVVDLEGNSASCTQSIMVQDNESPMFTAPVDIELACDVDVNDLTITGIPTGVTDCNAILDTMYSDVPGIDGCDGTGSIIRTWVIADACGNSASETQVITLVDDVPPTITAPADITIVCELDPQDTTITGGDYIVADNCSSIFIVTFSDVSTPACGVTGTIQRTWTAEDECGNVASAVQTITVIDTVAPTAVCMDITIDFSAGDVTLDPSEVDGGSFDNCGTVTLALSQTEFSCLSFGDENTQVIQLIVTDECGNESSCDVTVTGEGGSGLQINCPNPIFVNLGPGACEARVYYVVDVEPLCGSVDSITIEQIDNSGLTSGDYFPRGTTIQEYVAYTPFGDSSFCSFEITVYEFPEQNWIACNDSVTFSAGPNCEVEVLPDMILEGNVYGCYDDFLVEVENYGSGLGGITITDPVFGEWFNVTITNEDGLSCWGVMTMEDKLPPMITCLDVIVECGQNTDPVFIAPIIGDLSLTETPGSPIGPGGGVVTIQEFQVVAPAGAQVTDINVTIDLSHTWSSDLDVFLVGPDGSVVELATDVCGTGDDWANVKFDDDAAIPVASACTGGTPALTGDVQPEGILADFNGSNATGTWTVMITDDTNGDGGTLNLVTLDIAYFVSMPYAPVAGDACGPVTLTYEETEFGEDCDSSYIQRVWTATDESGNTASCLQTITIVPLTLDGLEFPQVYLGSCGDPIHPDYTGYPTINGVDVTDGGLCNIFVTWEDIDIAGCGGGHKIQRTWTVLDWCTEEIVEETQLLKFADDDAPIIICPDDVTIGSDPWFCTADVNLDPPVVTDLCGSAVTITPSATSGTLVGIGGFWQLTDLALGTHTVTWTAEDECGNSSQCSYDITIVDDVPPVPICDEHTVVSLTEDGDLEQGLTKVSAEVFDDGSYDNCSIISFKVRRMTSCIDFDWTTGGAGIDDIPNGIVNGNDKGTSFRPMVPFSCCDVGNGPIMVQLRVEDAAGNVNSCMVEVEVQDKIAPYLTAPPSVEVSCDFWFEANETNGFVDQAIDPLTPVFGRVLDAYSYNQSDRKSIIINDPGNDQLPQPYNWGLEGWADDNCAVEITVRVRIYNDCTGDDLPGGAPSHAVRLVERTFLAKDAQGNSNTQVQRIWVVDFDPFYIADETCNNSDPRDGVIWPCDVEYTTCPDSVAVDYPVIFDDNCSLIGVDYEDVVFDIVDGACYKILRTWSVIDWCQYNAQTGAGLWQYLQVIKVKDNDGPEVIQVAPFQSGTVTLCTQDSNVSLPANNQVLIGESNPLATSCSVHVVLEHQVIENCSDQIKYDVKFYPNNGSTYIQVLKQVTRPVDANGIATIVFDSKASSLLGVRLNGLPYNDKYCSPQFGGEKDYHRILWSMEDGCGNSSTYEYLLRLEDCKQPTPVCVGLYTAVMPAAGEVTIWAVDFNASSTDDCTAAADLLYSFSETEYKPSKNYTCQDISDNGGPTFIEDIYVADEGNDLDCNGIITWDERNKDYCTTFINVDDNDHVCPGDAPLGGIIQTEELESVETVNVTLRNSNGQVMQTFVTNGSGRYQFINPLIDYIVEPARNDDHANGVSTLDLVRIQQHLLGLLPLESPYKLIAADANNSESVTAIDLVEIRKLILGLYIEYPNNSSWRFVDADFVFNDPSSPWPFDEIIELESGISLNENFMAVKIGDVNGTVSANARSDKDKIETRNSASLQLWTENRHIDAGEIVEVPVYADNFEDMFGFQTTLMTSGLELTGVSAGTIDLSEDNVAVHKNAITMSWGRATAVSADEVLFTLVFKATNGGKLSQMLSVSSKITAAEAYSLDDGELSTIDMSLGFKDVKAEVSTEFALYQNVPNPFKDQTIVGFDLPSDMSATVTFYDVTGKIMEVVEGDFVAGYNEISIDRQVIGGQGVIYYRLDAGVFTGTKKMILIE